MSQEAIAELVLNGVLRAAIHMANTLRRAARRSQLGRVDPGQGSAFTLPLRGGTRKRAA